MLNHLRHTTHCTNHIVHCTIHTAHCTIQTAHCAIHTIHNKINTVNCTTQTALRAADGIGVFLFTWNVVWHFALGKVEKITIIDKNEPQILNKFSSDASIWDVGLGKAISPGVWQPTRPPGPGPSAPPSLPSLSSLYFRTPTISLNLPCSLSPLYHRHLFPPPLPLIDWRGAARSSAPLRCRACRGDSSRPLPGVTDRQHGALL